MGNFDGRSIDDYPTGSVVGIVIGSNAVLGVFGTCLSLVLLDLFRLHANFKTPFTAWAADTAFGAYLVQAYVIVPLVYACVGVLGASSPVYFRKGGTRSATCIGGAALWLCWAIVY